MAVLKVKADKSVLIFESFGKIANTFNSYFFITKILLIFMFVFSIFSPMLWFFCLFVYILMFNLKIWKKYFKNKELFHHYIEQFSCHTADNGTAVFSKYGYEIDFDTQWSEHLNKLGGYDIPNDAYIEKEELSKLASTLAKEAKKVKSSQSYRESGIGRDLATRHLIFIGTTGAGKTESLMTWFADIVDKRNSGGIVMIDGKADSKIHQKLSALLAEKGRMTSYNTINFLKQEKMSVTNTYNPILSMSPYKGVSFMGSLLPSGEGGGNADYFKQRGIAMLTIPLSALKIRNEFFNEPFSLSLLQNSTSSFNMTIIFSLFYGFVREENDRLKHLIDTNETIPDLRE